MYCRYPIFAAFLALVGCAGGYPGDEATSVTPAFEASEEPTTGEVTDATSQRKIIYTATVDLVVQDFGQTEKQVTELVSQMGGYVAEFREDRRYGAQLGGQWKVRIPVSQFDAFVEQVLDLGVPMMRQVNAQDVTEQYIDLTARLKNKRRLEERILKLLEDQTAEIKDVIEVESQLGRVREEIEVLEGRLRYLTDQIDLTTVTITVREDRSYTPAQAPTFATKVKNMFFISLRTLRQFGEGVVLLVVAAAPWLLLACFVFTPPLIWLRSRRRR